MKIDIPDSLCKRLKKLELYEFSSKEEMKEQIEETVIDFLEDCLSEAHIPLGNPQDEDEL